MSATYYLPKDVQLNFGMIGNESNKKKFHWHIFENVTKCVLLGGDLPWAHTAYIAQRKFCLQTKVFLGHFLKAFWIENGLNERINRRTWSIECQSVWTDPNMMPRWSKDDSNSILNWFRSSELQLIQNWFKMNPSFFQNWSKTDCWLSFQRIKTDPVIPINNRIKFQYKTLQIHLAKILKTSSLFLKVNFPINHEKWNFIQF